MRFFISVALVMAPLVTFAARGAPDEVLSDVGAAAAKVAPVLKPKILEKQGIGSPFRIAVFPLGNVDGKSNLSLGSVGKTFQGELIRNLAQISEDKFVPMNLGEIRQAFRTLNDEQMSALSTGDVSNIALTAQAANVDAIVVGNMDVLTYSAIVSANKTAFSIIGRLVFKDASFVNFTAQVDRADLGTAGGSGPLNLPTRFVVQFLLANGSGGFDALPMKLGKANTDGTRSEFSNVYFVELPANAVGKTYTLTFKNTGIPGIGDKKNSDDAKEKNRQYAVAALVDGVNTIWMDTGRKIAAGQPNAGQPEIGPVILHPKDCQKWVLTGPGKQYQTDGTLVDVPSGPDGSSISLPGFQKITGVSAGVAGLFTLAKTGESIAYKVGVNNDIGLIALHFYPEDLPGDPLSTYAYPLAADPDRPGETLAGTEVTHPTVNVKVKIKGNPSQVVRIFYYYTGTPPTNNGTAVPITP
jgi:hypothetical protein